MYVKYLCFIQERNPRGFVWICCHDIFYTPVEFAPCQDKKTKKVCINLFSVIVALIFS